ncbi:hypothetical protein ACFL6S_33295 [Candidatus Poribacteria bacterium]
MASADNAAGARANGIDTGIRGFFSRGDARKCLTRWLIVSCHDRKHLTRMGRVYSELVRTLCSVSGYGAYGGQYRLKIPNGVRVRSGIEIFQFVSATIRKSPTVTTKAAAALWNTRRDD